MTSRPLSLPMMALCRLAALAFPVAMLCQAAQARGFTYATGRMVSIQDAPQRVCAAGPLLSTRFDENGAPDRPFEPCLIPAAPDIANSLRATSGRQGVAGGVKARRRNRDGAGDWRAWKDSNPQPWR